MQAKRRSDAGASSISSLLGPDLNVEFLQLVAKHAPLELGLLSEQQLAGGDANTRDQQTSHSPRRSRKHAPEANSTRTAARHTRSQDVHAPQSRHGRPTPSGSTHSKSPRHASNSQVAANSPSNGWLEDVLAADRVGLATHLQSGTAARGHVKVNPKLLPNPVDQQRALAQQRMLAAHMIADRSRLQAQAHSKAVLVAQQQEQQRLASALQAANHAAQQEVQTAVTVSAPQHGGEQAHNAARHSDSLGGDQARHGNNSSRKAKDGAGPAAGAVGEAAVGATATLEDGGSAERVAKPSRPYKRPWSANMAKPNSKPRCISPADVHMQASATAGAYDVGGMQGGVRALAALAASKPLQLLQEGPLGSVAARAVSPGTVRLDTVDANVKQQIKAYMERKRAALAEKQRDEEARAEAARMRPLTCRKTESLKARLEARLHAEALQQKPHPQLVRRAWVDIDPQEPVLLPTSGPRPAGRNVTGHNQLGFQLDDASEPDVDAVSLRAQPNHIVQGLQHEARGSHVKVISHPQQPHVPRQGHAIRVEYDQESACASGWGGSQVIRVRDPAPRAKSAPRTRSPPCATSAGPVRAASPGRMLEARVMDVASRRMAMREYGELVRQQLMAQLKEEQKDARRKLRKLRKSSNSTAATAASTKANAKKRSKALDRRSCSPPPHSYGPVVSKAGAKGMPSQRVEEQPDAEAVAALKAIVMQLAQRINNLQQEAQQEKARASSQPKDRKMAWGEPVLVPTSQQNLSRAVESEPSLQPSSAHMHQQDGFSHLKQQGAESPRLRTAYAPVVVSPTGAPTSPALHSHMQLLGSFSPRNVHRLEVDYDLSQQPTAQQHSPRSCYSSPADGCSPEVPMRVSALHTGSQQPAGPESPSMLSTKKPRLSLEDHQVRPEVLARPSRIPAIRVPTSTQHAIPDPNAPFPHGWDDAVSHQDAGRHALQGLASDSDDDGRASHSRANKLQPHSQAAAGAGNSQQAAGGSHEAMACNSSSSAAPSDSYQAALRSSNRTSTSGSSSATSQGQGGCNVLDISELQDMVASTDELCTSEVHGRPVDVVGKQQEQAVLGPQAGPALTLRPATAQSVGHQGAVQQGVSSSAGYTVGVQHGVGLKEGQEDPCLNSPPLSPDSDLNSYRLGVGQPAWQEGLLFAQPMQDCAAIVQQHEARGGSPLRLKLAARALQEAAQRNKQLMFAQPQPTEATLLAAQQQDLSSDDDALAFARIPKQGHDPLSVMHLATKAVLARRTVAISIPQPAAQTQADTGPSTGPTATASAAQGGACPTHALPGVTSRASQLIQIPGGTSVSAVPAFTLQQNGWDGHATAPTNITQLHSGQQSTMVPHDTAPPSFPAAMSMMAGFPPYVLPAAQTSPSSHLRAPAMLQHQAPLSVQPHETNIPPQVLHPIHPYQLPDDSSRSMAAQQHQQRPASPNSPLSPAGGTQYDSNRAELPGRAAAVPPVGLLPAVGGLVGRPRLSPVELQHQLEQHVRRLEEMERVGSELCQLEQARAVAEVQAEARRIATLLDQALADQQRTAAMRHNEQRQEQRLQAIADNLRKEVQNESMAQFKEVATMFAQQIKSNKVAHAELQTSLTDPAAVSLMHASATEPAVVSASHSTQQPPTRTKVHSGGAKQFTAQSNAIGSRGTLLPHDSQASGATASDELYSDVFESAEKTAEEMLFPKTAHTSGCISNHAASEQLHTTDAGMSTEVAAHGTSSSFAVVQADTSGSGTVASGAVIGSGTPHSQESGWSAGQQIAAGVLTGSSSVLDEVSGSASGSRIPTVTIGASSTARHASSSSWSLAAAPATDMAADPCTPTANPRGTPTAVQPQQAVGERRSVVHGAASIAPFTAIRATATGELCITESELLEMMQQVEASAQQELVRLQQRKEDLEVDAAAQLKQLSERLASSAGQERLALLKAEMSIGLKLQMQQQFISRQILAVQDDLTMRKMQMHQLYRLVETLSETPNSLPRLQLQLQQYAHGSTPQASMRGRGTAAPAHQQEVTPTRSVASRTAGHSGMSTDMYSEDFEVAGASSSILHSLQRSLPEEGHLRGASSMRRSVSGSIDDEIGLSGSRSPSVISESPQRATSARSGGRRLVPPARMPHAAMRRSHEDTPQLRRSQDGGLLSRSQEEEVTSHSHSLSLHHTSSRSSLLEAQKQQLVVQLQRKQAGLRSQQRKQEIAVLQEQLGDVEQQLAVLENTPGRIRSQPPHVSSRHRDALGTATGTATISDVSPQTDDVNIRVSVASDAAHSVPESGTPASVPYTHTASPTARSLVSESYSRDPTGSGDRPGFDRRSDRRTSVGGASTDSLEAAAQHVRQLQQQLQQKQREARRAELAAQQAQLQKELALADKQIAAAHKSASKAVAIPAALPATTQGASDGITEDIEGYTQSFETEAAVGHAATRSLRDSPGSQDSGAMGAPQDSSRLATDQHYGAKTRSVQTSNAGSVSSGHGGQLHTAHTANTDSVGSVSHANGRGLASVDSPSADRSKRSSERSGSITGSNQYSQDSSQGGSHSQGGLAGIHDASDLQAFEIEDAAAPDELAAQPSSSHSAEVAHSEHAARARTSDDGSGPYSAEIEYSQDSGSEAASRSEQEGQSMRSASSVHSDTHSDRRGSGAEHRQSSRASSGSSPAGPRGHVLLDIDELEVMDAAEASSAHQSGSAVVDEEAVAQVTADIRSPEAATPVESQANQLSHSAGGLSQQPSTTYTISYTSEADGSPSSIKSEARAAGSDAEGADVVGQRDVTGVASQQESGMQSQSDSNCSGSQSQSGYSEEEFEQPSSLTQTATEGILEDVEASGVPSGLDASAISLPESAADGNSITDIVAGANQQARAVDSLQLDEVPTAAEHTARTSSVPAYVEATQSVKPAAQQKAVHKVMASKAVTGEVLMDASDLLESLVIDEEQYLQELTQVGASSSAVLHAATVPDAGKSAVTPVTKAGDQLRHSGAGSIGPEGHASSSRGSASAASSTATSPKIQTQTAAQSHRTSASSGVSHGTQASEEPVGSSQASDDASGSSQASKTASASSQVPSDDEDEGPLEVDGPAGRSHGASEAEEETEGEDDQLQAAQAAFDVTAGNDDEDAEIELSAAGSDEELASFQVVVQQEGDESTSASGSGASTPLARQSSSHPVAHDNSDGQSDENDDKENAQPSSRELSSASVIDDDLVVAAPDADESDELLPVVAQPARQTDMQVAAAEVAASEIGAAAVTAAAATPVTTGNKTATDGQAVNLGRDTYSLEYSIEAELDAAEVATGTAASQETAAETAAVPHEPEREASGGSESDASVLVSDYSMSFEGDAELVVDASPVASPVKASSGGQQAGADKHDKLADDLTDHFVDTTLRNSVEAIVSVAGGPEAVLPSLIASPSSGNTPHTPQAVEPPKQAAAAATAQQPTATVAKTAPGPTASKPAAGAASDLISSETLDAVSPENESPPAKRVMQRQNSDNSDDAWGTNDLEYSADDLAWQDEELGDFEVNLGAYLVPEKEREARQQELAAAAAPAVCMTPQAVKSYLEQVLATRLKEQGPWPQELGLYEEALALEGFLAVERNLTDASEAQHIANKLLYDAANEAILKIYRNAHRIKAPGACLSTSQTTRRPLPAPAQLLSEVQAQVQTWLGSRIQGEHELDKLLAQDAVEDERQWALLKDEAEVEVKLEIADLLWEELLADTAETVKALDSRLAQKQRHI